MIWPYDFGLLLLVIVTALLALNLRDLMGASIVFGTYSFLMCFGQRWLQLMWLLPRLQWGPESVLYSLLRRHTILRKRRKIENFINEHLIICLVMGYGLVAKYYSRVIIQNLPAWGDADILLSTTIVVCVIGGLFFFLGASVGILRFPGFLHSNACCG